MHVSGSGFTGWGAVLAAGFRYEGAAESIDASAFRGVSFYARTGPDSNAAIRVQLQDVSTYPEGMVCDPEPSSAEECYNGFGTTLLELDEAWQKLTLDFSTLAQREGWGYRADALDTSALYAIEWNFDANQSFDLWIDDIWFYE
jgi:hypothetical protein